MTSVPLVSLLADLPAYTPGRTVPGAVKLASNELAFPTLAAVRDTIVAHLDRGATAINRYPDPGAAELVQRLAALAGTTVDRIAVGSGSVALCQQLVQISCEPGDEVLFGWRSFEAYPIVSLIGRAVPVRVPLTPGHGLDLAAMAAAVTDRTKLVYLCSPNNPTGTSLTTAEIESFLDLVPDRVLVVIDEAYREFDRGTDSPDGARIADGRSNVVALRTLSKAYGLAGLRVGYAVGDPAIVRALGQVVVPFAVNSLAQEAAVAALDSADELQSRWDQVVDERVRVTAALRGIGYEIPYSQANFVWLPLEVRATEFAAHCARHRVIVRPFAEAGGGVRVSIGAPEENDLFLTAAAAWPGRA